MLVKKSKLLFHIKHHQKVIVMMMMLLLWHLSLWFLRFSLSLYFFRVNERRKFFFFLLDSKFRKINSEWGKKWHERSRRRKALTQGGINQSLRWQHHCIDTDICYHNIHCNDWWNKGKRQLPRNRNSGHTIAHVLI